MNNAQRESLKFLWESNPTIQEPFREESFDQASALDGLPNDWVVGWIGSIFVGCSPEGRIHS